MRHMQDGKVPPRTYRLAEKAVLELGWPMLSGNQSRVAG